MIGDMYGRFLYMGLHRASIKFLDTLDPGESCGQSEMQCEYNIRD